MQAVPNLVGAGTATANVNNGLVIAQPATEPSPGLSVPVRPVSETSFDRVTSTGLLTLPSRAPLSQPTNKSAVRVLDSSTAMNVDDRVRNVSGSSNTSTTSSHRPSLTAQSEASAATLSTIVLSNSSASSNAWIRRHSLINRGDRAPPLTSEGSRDSISSNESWIRRFSIRPLSQHGSTRSSVGPDALSLNFSLGSAAPFLSQESSAPPQQTRNKLVKRTTTNYEPSASLSLSRRGSRSQMPIFRRPATSHQRSATLHQAPNPDDLAHPASHVADRKYSLDQSARTYSPVSRPDSKSPDLPFYKDNHEGPNGKPEQVAFLYGVSRLPQQAQQKQKRLFPTRWSSFFHGRLTKSTTSARDDMPYLGGNSPVETLSSFPSHTIQVQRSKQPKTYPMQATDLSTLEPASGLPPVQDPIRPNETLCSSFQSSSPSHLTQKTANDVGDDVSLWSHGSNSSLQGMSPNIARRSVSMNFESPTSWMLQSGKERSKRNTEYPPNASLTGSLRINKKFASAAVSHNVSTAEKRHVSAPLYGLRRFTAQLPHQHVQMRSLKESADLGLQNPLDDISRQAHSSDAAEQNQDNGCRKDPLQLSFVQARATSKRQRNRSSPLPPLSRSFSLNVDLPTSEAPPCTSRPLAPNVLGTTAHKENHAFPLPGSASLSRSFSLVPRNRDVPDEPSSTFVGSELELRGFASSVDDDDTDFKSDTIFDSIRTAASARLQSAGTPIESMFDESPPSTAGNGKAKRLSIQEILGQTWGSETRIAEDNDGFLTPMQTISDPWNGSLSPASFKSYQDGNHKTKINHHYSSETDFSNILPSTNTNACAVVAGLSSSRPSLEDDDGDDDWARIDDSGLTNHLSPPSRIPHDFFNEKNGSMFALSSERGSSRQQRPALGLISGNGGLDPSGRYDSAMAGAHERPKSTLFDWCEPTTQLDKSGSDSQSPRPKTVHGKQELDLKNRRFANRKGPAVAHVRSQSVPVNVDPAADGAKPVKPKFGTWASGPKNASEDWDDDFDFGTNNGCDDENESDLFGIDEESTAGQSSTLRSSKGPGSTIAMIVPASIQATQPTVKAHSGQIRELSLLVHGLKRLCRHARDLNIVDETPALWKEAENIIALASPDEDLYEATATKTTKTAVATPPHTTPIRMAATESDSNVPRASIEFDVSIVEDQFLNGRFDCEGPTSFEDGILDISDFSQTPASPNPPEMSRTAVVRERPNTRRRSVFSPDDDIFGGSSPQAGDKAYLIERSEAKEAPRRPQTPYRFTSTNEMPDSNMIESIMEAMQQQRSASAPIRKSPVKQSSTSELFFNTNTLQELVKRANSLFHTLSDLVRRTELFTQSPAVTPRHDRLNRCEDGSPAFTRVFTDPSSPSKRLPKSHSGNSITRGSPALESPSTNKVSQRLQLMTLS